MLWLKIYCFSQVLGNNSYRELPEIISVTIQYDMSIAHLIQNAHFTIVDIGTYNHLPVVLE